VKKYICKYSRNFKLITLFLNPVLLVRRAQLSSRSTHLLDSYCCCTCHRHCTLLWEQEKPWKRIPAADSSRIILQPILITVKVLEAKKKVIFYFHSLSSANTWASVRYVDLYLSCFPFLPVRHWTACVYLMWNTDSVPKRYYMYIVIFYIV
jgi:hypothetical protein